MRWLDRFLSSDRFGNLRLILADLVELVVLAYLLWGFYQAVTLPYDGVFAANFSGLITQVDAIGPSSGLLQAGDVILSIEGVPWKSGLPDYRLIGAGNEVQFAILRAGKTLIIPVPLQSPPLSELFRRISPLIVALAFWVVGVGVHMFNSPIPSMHLFFILFLTSSTLLTSGFLSSMGMGGITNIFGFLLWLIGPLTVHLHFYFPQTFLLRYRRVVLAALYGVGLLGGGLHLIWTSTDLLFTRIAAFWEISARLFLVFCLLWVIGLLWYSYRHAIAPGTQWKVRLIALGCILSLLPIISLTILPDTLFNWPILPFHYAFLLLGLVPVTYGYVVFRPRLLRVERRVSRVVVYLSAFTVLGSLFAILIMFIHRGGFFTSSQAPLVSFLLILVFIGLYIVLFPQVDRIVDTIFYGGWYDYHSAMVQIVNGLETYSDLSLLADTISNRLLETLRLSAAGVLLRDSQGDFSIFSARPVSFMSTWPIAELLPLPSESLAFFREVGMKGAKALLDEQNEGELSVKERQFLSLKGVALWVPARGYGQIQGVLALGGKYGGDIFSQEDLNILSLVAQQIGSMVDNLHLLTQLRTEASKLEQKVRERTAELHDSKERVEAILASVADGVIVTDLEGRILTVNAAFEHRSGYRTTELEGQEFSLLFDDQTDASVFEEMRSILSTGKPWSGALIGCCKDGSKYHVQLTAAPVRDQEGKIIGYVGSQHDITRQKELEQLKDQLITNISHDLRTPITNICLYLDVLESARPENREKVLSVLKEQSHLLRSMVSDVLNVQQMTTNGMKKAEFVEVNLNDLAQEVFEMYAPLAEAASLHMIFEPCMSPTLINGEPEQLARAIASLLANAIRYTPAGEVGMRVQRSAERVCLEVWDTGAGIDAEDLPHIFDPFYRGHRFRESEMIGSGLGLTIVRQVVKEHSGMVEVESEPGKGSQFYICFPV